MKQWCDVQDQDGFWKIGYIIQKQQTQKQSISKVRIDGYHPGYDTFYCNHSKKLYPVRTYTMGFNSTPANSRVLRQPLKLDELTLNHNRLILIGRMQNLLQSTEQNIKIFMRTELLVLIDKIIRTPFQLINSLKMADLWINKLFIGIINFYLKLLDSSKKFLPLLDSDNKMAKELVIAMYEFSTMAKLIIGSHKASKTFFQDPTNLTIKPDGFIDCFIMSDHGILPFKTLFKSLTSISLKKIDKKMTEAVFQILQFFLDLCQRSKGELFQSNFLPQTKIVVDQIINFLKVFSAIEQQNLKYLKFKVQIINRLQTLQLKLKPKKSTLLRNEIFSQNKQNEQNEIQSNNKQKINEASSEELQSLKVRVKKLEDILGNLTVNQNREQSKLNSNQESVIKNIKNLGEQQFLASLSWALNCGDLQICKKLVNWRQNLLKLGRIAGWEIALQVGLKTMKTAEITHSDIIQANIQMIHKSNQQKQAVSLKQKSLSLMGQKGKSKLQNPTKIHPQKE